MALQKKPIGINFVQGVDTKTDPNQIPPGKFSTLRNSVFTRAERLTKRDGFAALATPSDASMSYISTYKNNLVGLGSSVSDYVPQTNAWQGKTTYTPLQLSTKSLIRNSFNETFADIAYASNGLACAVYTTQATTGSNIFSYFAVFNPTTGDILFNNNTAFTSMGQANYPEVPRIYFFNNLWVILYIDVSNHLVYATLDPANYGAGLSASTTLATDYAAALPTTMFDAVVDSARLYVAYLNNSNFGSVFYLDNLFAKHGPTTTAVATSLAFSTMSIVVDTSVSPHIFYVNFLDGLSVCTTFAVNASLGLVFAGHNTTFSVPGSTSLPLVTAYATAGACTVYASYFTPSPWGGVEHVYETSFFVINQAGTVTTGVTGFCLGVGIASKIFVMNSIPYLLTYFSSPYQPAYYLFDARVTTPRVVGRFAVGNTISTLSKTVSPIPALPTPVISSSIANMPYLFSDQTFSSSSTFATFGTATGIFSLQGVNTIAFDFSNINVHAVEIGQDLIVSGGVVSSYDGTMLTEQNFFMGPEKVVATVLTEVGTPIPITAGTYTYQAVYQWTDSAGNLFQSLPSIPSDPVTLTLATPPNYHYLSVNISNLRLTNKSNVRIVVYRASVAQPTYYRVTPVLTPLLNDPTADFTNLTDTGSDSSLTGNDIVYTTGGVLPNVSPPSAKVMGTYKSRFFLVDAEDENVVWYSKQTIDSVPVEMSDFLTIFVSPNISNSANSGGVKAFGTLDDKFVLFTNDIPYYIVGSGPDNTGSNNDFSDPILINSTVGCGNQNSVVAIPQGIIFQSPDKGFWILKRDLSTAYIGAPVEAYNSQQATSAQIIPNSTQVRFTFSGGTMLMYDYFYDQWGEFPGLSVLSSTLYSGAQAILTTTPLVLLQTPNTYLDNGVSVAMKFQTGWFSLGGLQGFGRAYFFYLLANYLSPHQIKVEIAVDYNPTILQTLTITPDASNSVEQWRVFFDQTTSNCEAFQLTITEINPNGGAGFTLSGLDLIVGVKGVYPRLPAASTIG